MKLSMNATGYRVMERILNVCINYANEVIMKQNYFSRQIDCYYSGQRFVCI